MRIMRKQAGNRAGLGVDMVIWICVAAASYRPRAGSGSHLDGRS